MQIGKWWVRLTNYPLQTAIGVVLLIVKIFWCYDLHFFVAGNYNIGGYWLAIGIIVLSFGLQFDKVETDP